MVGPFFCWALFLHVIYILSFILDENSDSRIIIIIINK